MGDESGSDKEAGERRPGGHKQDGSDPSDWIASFRDVDFSWSQQGRGREPPTQSDDEWWFAPKRRPDANRSATAPRDTAAPTPDDRSRATSGGAIAGAATVRGKPRVRRWRKRLAIVAAVIALFVVGAVGGVAVIAREGEDTSSSSAATTASTKASTTTATTAPPTAVTTAPTTVPPTPGPFTVTSTCRGRDCSVTLRDGPSLGAKNVGTLRTGDVVQISCSTHGASVRDSDTGQQSDVWYRLADRPGYSSALYLQGPTVPDCG